MDHEDVVGSEGRRFQMLRSSLSQAAGKVLSLQTLFTLLDLKSSLATETPMVLSHFAPFDTVLT